MAHKEISVSSSVVCVQLCMEGSVGCRLGGGPPQPPAWPAWSPPLDWMVVLPASASSAPILASQGSHRGGEGVAATAGGCRRRPDVPPGRRVADAAMRLLHAAGASMPLRTSGQAVPWLQLKMLRLAACANYQGFK